MKNEVIQKKIDFFFERNQKVHIKLANRFFLNGTINFQESPETIIFIDDKIGSTRIFIDDIFDIQEFLEGNK